MVGRNRALIDPEQIDVAIHGKSGENGKECGCDRSAGQRHDKSPASRDDLRGLHGELFCKRTLKDAEIVSDNAPPGHVHPPPTRLLASAGPALPHSYTNNGFPCSRTGFTIAHAASTASWRANSVGSPSIASPIRRSCVEAVA